ncbi:transcription elongation factor spt4 [Coemansia sp. RSA 1813]|nr:transcription elongation factor spt4 [Coemansia sp. RSA 1646]KAJ1773131.1 transcription elongation factor spt4 [Coemansia sp. RSA 1843]KAJ2092008.1 transcription elongation factor spt4 [Coemansia sp. RSA 986]KAJ2216655.1 transcription elongation factor spt4 [Coemansia sp. RSA 487]KAJ2572059.1 transcription elongation factor spt4 [Coemansia sp. RSA 1813]
MASVVPKDKRQLRACLICGIVLNHQAFRDHGCPNCESYVRMRGQNDVVADCTTTTFDGVMAMFQPNKSWVAKFAHVNSYKPGVYASHVTGRIPEDIEDALTQKGITYHPRDGTADE